MNLARSLLAACERHPELEAFPGLTYGELLPRVRRLAGGLSVEPGERVAVVLDNRLDREPAGQPAHAGQELAVGEPGERLELGMALARGEQGAGEVHAGSRARVDVAHASIASTIGA